MNATFDVAVVGAGPAGLAAAVAAAESGRRVVLLEKAARPGVKILVSGGNRCNLTHDCDAAEVARAFGRAGGRFLGAALKRLGPRALREWIESLGVPTKVEPGGKVFPVSNRAVDVRDALEREMERAGVTFVGRSAVVAAERACESGADDGGGGFVVRSATSTWRAGRLVLALGGRSYPKVGTTGDGYALARAFGHSVRTTTPALVPLQVETPWVRALAGVTLEEVGIQLCVGNRGSDTRQGALLFTHFGLSGPAPMNLGGAVGELAAAEGLGGATLRVNFVPQLGPVELEARLAAGAADTRLARAALSGLLPRRLAEALLQACDLPPAARLAELGRASRQRLVLALTATRLPLQGQGTRGFDFAEVTRGGVPLAEIVAATMASKLVPDLYLCGELLDLDGPIGGYNFTAAFATGRLAGEAAAAAIH